jgi:hypothetical protein
VQPNALDKGTGKGTHWCSCCRELVQLALGLCRVLARQRNWQRGPREASLPRAGREDIRQRESLCRVSWWHSTKSTSPLPSAVTATFHCRVPDKKYPTKKSLPMYSSLILLCRVSHSTKTLHECHHVPLLYDSTSVISVAKNPVMHLKTKHIDVHFHFLRDHSKKGDIDLRHVDTHRQLADIFTKPLDQSTFTHLRGELGVCFPF